MSTEATLNIPQLIVILVLGFLAIRWYLSSSSTSTSNPRSRQRVDPRHVDHVAQIYPQADRRSIAWDLQRNGGNVAATTERLIQGRGLDVPPPSFTYAPPTPLSTPSSTNTTTRPSKPTHPDLITRYNLTSRISDPSGPSTPTSTTSQSTPPPPTWSTSKTERAQSLQKRREEMILAARRKMEERDRAGKAA